MAVTFSRGTGGIEQNILPPCKKIIIETIHSTQYCCFYDYDKKFISNFSLSAGLNELTLSENVSFFIISDDHSSMSSLKIYFKEENNMAIKSADQITIIDVTDAYSVTLSSETYTFVGGTSGAASGQTCTTEACAFCGSNMCSSITVDKAEVTCPTGISATVENSGSSKVKITFTTTATITSACEATIPIKIGEMTFNKKFSFAVAKTGQTGQTGATGVGVKSVANKYLTTSASEGVTISTSGWSDNPTPTSTSKETLVGLVKALNPSWSSITSLPHQLHNPAAHGVRRILDGRMASIFGQDPLLLIQIILQQPLPPFA